MASGHAATSGAATTSTRTPSQQTLLTQAQMDAKAGDLWSTQREGEDWPIVICDEEMVQNFFKWRADNSRQADGTWVGDYKDGGPLVGERCLPAMYFGAWVFCWVPMKKLDPFDIQRGLDDRDSTTNPEVAKAWDEANEQYWKPDLSGLKSALYTRSLQRLPSSRTEKEKMNEKRKRKGTPQFKYPPGYAREEIDDDESSLFLDPFNNADPKIKKEIEESTNSVGNEDLYEDPESSSTAQAAQRSKRNKLDISGRSSTRLTTPLGSGTQSRLATPMRFSGRRTPFKSTKESSVNDSDATIYVGNPHEEFKVKRCSLDASPLLSGLLTHHPENGWYLMSPMLSAIDTTDFAPVSQFLARGEYRPNILDSGTDFVRLEESLTASRCGEEMVRCGTIYNIAHRLELPCLQDLAFRKLQVLVLQSYPASAFLIVVERVFEDAKPDMRQFTVEYCAARFWDLVKSETTKLVEVMKCNEELATGVFEQLSGLAKHDSCAEAKQEMKKEVKDERKIGKEVSQKSKEEPKKNGDLSQTEEGIAKKALRESLEEQNEGEWGGNEQYKDEIGLAQSEFFEAY